MVTETFTAGEDFIVPDGVFSLTLELEGEGGGGTSGGSGGRVVGTYEDVVPGDSISIRESVGGTGNNDGGASIDIRIGGTTLSDRVAVAGGAGGSSDGLSSAAGGDGGADTGADGAVGSADTAATGGTQSAGGTGGTGFGISGDGAFGTGGEGAISGSGTNGSGGGGGWYGGGGGGGSGSGQPGGGGAGGSNYDDGLDSVTANERGTSTRSFGQGGLVTITYDPVPGAENLTITDTTATSNTLAWDAPTLPPEVDSIDQYRVYRDTDSGTVRADYTEVGTTPTPGFEDAGLDNGTEYHYRVGADLFVPEPVGTITITDFRGV
jgi:hypothetical protein